jgi:hypothetical protein
MLSLLALLALSAQRATAEVVASPSVAPTTVRGTVELSEREADAAAWQQLLERVAGDVRSRAARITVNGAPAWLPEFCRDQVVDGWIAGLDLRQCVRITERVREPRDHGSLGWSFRTTLTAEVDDRRLDQALAGLARKLRGAARGFLSKCAGIVGSWLCLAALVAWLDRQSRGYMTGRLRVLAACAGVLVPCVVFPLA